MSKRKKTMQLLPLGSRTEEAWRMVDELAPDKADALAVSAFRYALTGDNADGPGVPARAWAKAKGEIDLLLIRRGANPWGRNGKPKGEPNAEPNARPASSLSSEEERRENNPKIDDARETRAPTSGTSVLIPSISSDFGIHPPSPSSDFGAWARMQEDPVNVALAVSRESEKVRKVYGWTLKECREAWGREEGTRRFVEECVDFNAECEAGEEPRNRGAALVARLRTLADGPGMVAPSKVSPPPKVEAAPVQAEPALPPTVEAVEAVEVEEENPAPPSPMPELVEDAPKPTDAVSLALCVCNGGEDERGMVAGLLAVCKRIPGCYEEGFLKRCKAYSQNDTRTPLNFESFLRGAFPDTVWNQAEQAARTNGEL